MKNEIQSTELFSKIADLLHSARQHVVRAVNQTMVYTYYEIGRMIVEDEQQGKERAEYGKQVLKELSVKLTTEFGKGFSADNLENMRRFFLAYSISETTSRKFNLSWSHYLKLMRIANPDERSFYEIECAAGNWSLKELQRQFDSALYERLVLSRDKEGIRQLAAQGQIVEKPTDILKDLGQMQMYVHYHDRFVKLDDENKTIGIVLCKDKSQTLVEITLPETNDQIFASQYQTVLPDKQAFINLLNEGIG